MAVKIALPKTQTEVPTSLHTKKKRERVILTPLSYELMTSTAYSWMNKTNRSSIIKWV